jgi:hypothetical protein
MSDVNSQRTAQRPKSVVGPDGKALTLDDLPPPNTQRWVARRKAEVVAAVRAGLLSLDDACRRYSLSTEEFLGWEAAIDKHGLGGLRVTAFKTSGDAPPPGPQPIAVTRQELPGLNTSSTPSA